MKDYDDFNFKLPGIPKEAISVFIDKFNEQVVVEIDEDKIDKELKDFIIVDNKKAVSINNIHKYDVENASYKYEYGILTVKLPYSKEYKPIKIGVKDE